MTPRVAAVYRQVASRMHRDPEYSRYWQREWQRYKDAARTAGAPEAGMGNMAQQATALGVRAAARGAARLPPAELTEMAELKLRLLQRSSTVCLGSWADGVLQQDLMRALDAAYSDAELRRWCELTVGAMLLEVHAKEPLPSFSEQALSESLSVVLEALPPPEATVLAQTMQAGTSAAPEAGCKALQQLLEGGLALPEPQRTPFLLVILFPALVEEHAVD